MFCVTAFLAPLADPINIASFAAPVVIRRVIVLLVVHGHALGWFVRC